MQYTASTPKRLITREDSPRFVSPNYIIRVHAEMKTRRYAMPCICTKIHIAGDGILDSKAVQMPDSKKRPIELARAVSREVLGLLLPLLLLLVHHNRVLGLAGQDTPVHDGLTHTLDDRGLCSL